MQHFNSYVNHLVSIMFQTSAACFSCFHAPAFASARELPLFTTPVLEREAHYIKGS